MWIIKRPLIRLPGGITDQTLPQSPCRAFASQARKLRLAIAVEDKNSIGNVAYPDYAQKVRRRNLIATLACYALCRKPADNNTIVC